MKWSKRVLIAVGVLAVLVVGAGLVSLYFLPETEFIRTTVQERLREATGQDITIAGITVERSFSDVIRVQLTGIDAKSSEGTKLFSVKRVQLSPELSALLRRHLVVKSVVVEGLWTSVERDRDGIVRTAFIPAPASSIPSATSAPGLAYPKQPTTERVSDPKPILEPRSFNWSVESVRFTDCRVDFSDERVRPGKRIVLGIQGLNGTLVQRKPDEPVQVDLTATVGAGSIQGSALRVTGPITLKPDRSGVERVAVVASAESVDFGPFEPYLPPSAAALKGLGLGGTHVRLDWQAGKPAQAGLETSVRDQGAHVVPVKAQCHIVPSDDLKSVREVGYSVAVKQVPYAFLRKFLPPGSVSIPEAGNLEANVQGTWSTDANLSWEGGITFDNPFPRPLEGIGKQIRCGFRMELSGETLLIRELQVMAPDPVASLTGHVLNPASPERSGELAAEMHARTAWLRELGIRLPKELALNGGFPVKGTVKGNAREIGVELAVDLTQTVLRWQPHLEKAAPAKAGLTAKGTIIPAGPDAVKQLKPPWDFSVRAHIDSAKARVVPKGPWIDHVSAHFEGRFVSEGGHVHLKGGNLGLRRGQRGEELLAVRADIRELDAAKPKFDGTGNTTLHQELLGSLAVELPKGLAFTGRAPIKAGLAGNPSAFKWTLDGTFTEAGVTFENAFRKPAGTAATLKVAGEWTENAIKLSDAKLTLPGVTVSAKGTVRSPHGSFEDLALEIKKADLKDVARYVPAMDGLRVAGPGEASMHWTKAGEGVAHRGTIRLLGVEFRPEKAAFGLAQVKGTAEIDGTSVQVPEAQGVMNGAVEAPVNAKASLTGVGSPETMNGTVSLKIGKGRIKADRIRSILQSVQVLAGSLLNPQDNSSPKDLLDIEYLTGDFVLKSGRAYTDSVKLRGGDITSGAIGSIDLKSQTLDAVVGIHTVMVADGSLGKIPAVRDFMKKHEEFLKNTGLDKAAERFGIKVPEDGKEPSEPQGPVKTPITVILDVKGPASAPKVTPILESKVDEKKLSKLKLLMEQ